jgi:hypothetical protein
MTIKAARSLLFRVKCSSPCNGPCESCSEWDSIVGNNLDLDQTGRRAEDLELATVRAKDFIAL